MSVKPNSPGTVDADYRGEVSALLYYLLTSTYADFGMPRRDPCQIMVRPGDRICQLVIAPVADIIRQPVPRDTLSKTERGEQGFGSTGIDTRPKAHRKMPDGYSAVLGFGDP